MIACRHCGALLPAGALFCGDCGRSVSAPPPGERTAPRNRLFPPPRSMDVQEDDASRASSITAPVEPLPAAPASEPDLLDDVEPALLEPDDPFEQQLAHEAGPAVDVEPSTPRPEIDRRRSPAPPILPVPMTTPRAPAPETAPATAGRDSAREVWVLQFSTGESVLVTGTGLVGRNPAAEPGEYVDHLVTLFDAGRSVSKTHLEFGHEQGRFWVSDRFSTNGSVIRPPDGPPRRCAPGRRYVLARGTRVDIGEQFFVVS